MVEIILGKCEFKKRSYFLNKNSQLLTNMRLCVCTNTSACICPHFSINCFQGMIQFVMYILGLSFIYLVGDKP